MGKYLPVYFAAIGLDRNLIGMLTFSTMGINFVGQQFWSGIIEWLGDFKSVLVATQVSATICLVFYTLPVVQENTGLILLTAVCQTFLASTGGTIIDAMCMQTLKSWEQRRQFMEQQALAVTPKTMAGSSVSYGETRLWSAVGWGGMSLLMGSLIDWFGLSAMFVGFGVIQTLNVSIVVFYMPQPEKKPPSASDTPSAQVTGCKKYSKICTLSAGLFFANLMVYGICMCLIENFLFIYLVQEFDGVSTTLLGGSTAVMCAFEIPVFAYLGPWLEKQPAGSESAFTAILLTCQLITALRCWLYAIMPRDMAWLVLAVGCLQGISFAAMWVASMEYAKRLSTANTLATMASLTGGIYYFLSMAAGCLIWGGVIMPSDQGGLGFRTSFYADAAAMLCWSVVWLGLGCLISKGSSDNQQNLVANQS